MQCLEHALFMQQWAIMIQNRIGVQNMAKYWEPQKTGQPVLTAMTSDGHALILRSVNLVHFHLYAQTSSAHGITV